MFSETKIDETFPNQQYSVSNYKTLPRDRNKHDQGLLFYIDENISCKIINYEEIASDIEMILFEVLLKTRKWLCVGIHKSSFRNENYFLDIFAGVWVIWRPVLISDPPPLIP